MDRVTPFSIDITIPEGQIEPLFAHLDTGNYTQLWELIWEEYGWECSIHPYTGDLTDLWPGSRSGSADDWKAFLQELVGFAQEGSSIEYEYSNGERYRLIFQEGTLQHHRASITYVNC